MIIEYIRYKVEPAAAQSLIDAYARAASSLEASPHCLGFELSQCNDEPGVFMLRIQWDSAHGHLEGFRKSAEFRSFFAEIRPFVNAIQEMRHYSLTSVCSR